jgi:hypothetical protein
MSDFYDVATPPSPRDRLGPIFCATFESDCAACSDLIVPGEDARSDGRGSWIHADDSCEAIATARAAGSDDRAAGRLCPACFTFHAGECL